MAKAQGYHTTAYNFITVVSEARWPRSHDVLGHMGVHINPKHWGLCHRSLNALQYKCTTPGTGIDGTVWDVIRGLCC